MIVDNPSQVTKAILAAHLAAFETEGLEGDDIGLDIIEFIALRMTTRDDNDVAELGYFVRANLLYLYLDQLSGDEVLNRFATAALAAPRGKAALIRSFDFTAHASPR